MSNIISIQVHESPITGIEIYGYFKDSLITNQRSYKDYSDALRAVQTEVAKEIIRYEARSTYSPPR